jgi:NADH-quinone oxidoreductase subunit B
MAEQPQGAASVPEDVQSNVLLTTVDWIYNTGRTFSLWPMSFGLACCAIEFIVTGTARYDLSRFGMEVIRPSPRQCDLLIISGTVTKKMVVPIVRLYNQMAEPRYVISMGACATGGGPFKEGYNVVSGIDKYLPVDVYVPGCPPTPEALLHGFISLQQKIRKQSVRTVPWYRKEYSSLVPMPVLGPDIFSSDPAAMRQVREINMQRMMAARTAGQLTIAELRHLSADECVTIRNGGLAQDMTGWRLISGQGDQTYNFPAGFVLMPDAEVHVHSGPLAQAATASDQIWSKQHMWRNEGDTASLIDADGNVISSFTYQGS